MNEKQIQHKCVLWFSQQFPERRGDVFATFQETVNAIQGSNMLSLGLLPGVSDLITLNLQKRMVPIEMKAPDTNHETMHVLEQCKFIYNSGLGWFCISLDSFKEIMLSDGYEGGITVDYVFEMCKDKLRKIIKVEDTDSIDDLLFKCNQWKDREYPKRKKKNPKIKKKDIIPPKVKF